VKNPYRASSRFWHAFLVTQVVIWWSIPWVAVGILLCASLIGIPLGILFIGIGCSPYAYLANRRISQLVTWDHRDRSYAEEYEEEVPWEL
jgi:hypothetical protein